MELLQLQFITMTQPREKTPVAEISQRGTPSCPLPVESWTALTSPGNDV